MEIRHIFAAELEAPHSLIQLWLWGPMFNIQENITMHFYTQYVLHTLEVFAVFW